jgi:SAM-dependent methyltransferase
VRAASTEPTFHFRGYEIPTRLCLLTGGGPETFAEISDLHIRNVNAACGLRADLRVLEVGCGIGRDAIPLTQILGQEGRYVGTDVIRESIAWCAENISLRHPNFAFLHQDIRDELHNPHGTSELESARLPAEDGWADLVVLQSVFTHMLPAGVSRYLQEFARVMHRRSLVYITAFVVDDHILETARRTNLTLWNLRFEHEVEDGVFVNDLESPTGAVAYREDVLDELAARSGLELVGAMRTGSWSGAHPVTFDGQDVVVLRRTG